MGWIEGLNASMEYIEKHLDDEIDVAAAARLATCSEGQFRRMFSYIAGAGLTEYIRRRRLSCAALDLSRGERVLDVAIRYGYASPTAFTRAFKEAFGVSPRSARQPGTALRVFPRLSFSLAVVGSEPLTWRIVTHDEMRLIGIALPCDAAKGIPLIQMAAEGREELRHFWGSASRAGDIERLLSLVDGASPQGILGVNAVQKGEPVYCIAVASSEGTPDWADEILVPRGSWAVFECIGPCDVATAEHYRRIYTEWLPTSGYELAHDVCLEVYPRGDFSSAAYRSEIWMPVIERFEV